MKDLKYKFGVVDLTEVYLRANKYEHQYIFKVPATPSSKEEDAIYAGTFKFSNFISYKDFIEVCNYYYDKRNKSNKEFHKKPNDYNQDVLDHPKRIRQQNKILLRKKLFKIVLDANGMQMPSESAQIHSNKDLLHIWTRTGTEIRDYCNHLAESIDGMDLVFPLRRPKTDPTISEERHKPIKKLKLKK